MYWREVKPRNLNFHHQSVFKEKKMNFLKMLIVGFTIILSANSFAQSFTVVVNNSVNISDIDKSELQRIYLGKIELWNNNTKIIPCYISPAKNEAGKSFFYTVIEMDLEKFNKTWLKKVFAGYGVKPNEFSDENDLIEFVSKTNGAIGFISTSSKGKEGSCKVIKLN